MIERINCLYSRMTKYSMKNKFKGVLPGMIKG